VNLVIEEQAFGVVLNEKLNINMKRQFLINHVSAKKFSFVQKIFNCNYGFFDSVLETLVKDGRA
jgi:hypothetical protein